MSVETCTRCNTPLRVDEGAVCLACIAEIEWGEPDALPINVHPYQPMPGEVPLFGGGEVA